MELKMNKKTFGRLFGGKQLQRVIDKNGITHYVPKDKFDELNFKPVEKISKKERRKARKENREPIAS